MIFEELAKAGGVGHGQANVFVEVKQLHFPPVDAWIANERIEEFELRCSTCSHHARHAASLDCLAYRMGSMAGSGSAERTLVAEYFHDHGGFSLSGSEGHHKRSDANVATSGEVQDHNQRTMP